MRLFLFLSCLLALSAARAADYEVNVALQKWGSSAQASSIFGPGYEAGNVLDGRMAGEHDKWNSAVNATPHWLVIDLGQERPVYKVVVRHEGVRGNGEAFNTGEFQLQRSISPTGPWIDQVPPIINNRDPVTERSFAPMPIRYLRLWITKGEQGGKNDYARIFEVEAYAQKDLLTEPLVGFAWAVPAKYRKTEGGSERLAVLEMVTREGGQEKLQLTVAGKPILELTPKEQSGIKEFWVPLKPGEKTTAVLGSGKGIALAKHEFSLSGQEYFTGGTLDIVSSSHQDTAWMDTPAACRRFRIENNIMPAMMMMRKDPNYTFCMEGTLHLMEFLEAHPELRGEVVQRMKEGRLEFGATYNQPYESWLSGEELIREAYFGRRWIMKNLPGCDAKVAFNPDPPARSLQMQQILAKAGIPYLFISRYHEGLYRWLSPDGTGVLLYTPGHYGNHLPFLNGTPETCAKHIQNKLLQQGPYYEKRSIPPVYCLINSMDFSEPVNFAPLIGFWNQPAVATDGGKAPTMRYSSIRGFFEAVDKPDAKFDTRMGERPDVWVYITGPTHHWTSDVRREAARLLPAAETFTTFASLLKGDNFRDWPSKVFDQAWMDEIYIDHGIGGKNGHITDEVFYRKVDNARQVGRTLLDQALAAIAAQVAPEQAAATPITVFNTLSWTRSAPLEIVVPETLKGPVHIEDANGQEIPCQPTTLGLPEDINVAATPGTKVTASSVFSPNFNAEKAINGKWAVQDPNPETGPSDKWNSAKGPGPHWLSIDFGQPQTIHQVVIRHEGVLGVCQDETKFNTADFQIQGADTPAGPWTDLVPPVIGNTASLTTHRFAPKTVRCLRLYITKGTQPGADQLARIYEIQAFAKAPEQPRKLVFVATGVPSLGYTTYRLMAGPPKATKLAVPTPELCENEFYRIELAHGGIKGLYDKQQKLELLNTGKFLGGEVFTMLSVAPGNRGAGTDAGEFGAIPLPVMDASFDRVADHKPTWKIIEQGPVRIVYQLEQPLADTTVRQRVIVWQQLKQIDCEADLLNFNGRLWREFRLALPLALEKPQLAYEVPMGVVEIGKDEVSTTGGHAYGGLTYFEQCKDIRPRMVQNFIDASDGNGGLTMSTSAAAFDWIDPTAAPVAYPVLQPVLLASRKSCNGEGVWYPQAGDHQYRFSISSHAGGWRNGRQDGIAANHPLQAVVGVKPAPGAALPPEMSFASVSASNVMVGTIKKCEDDNSVIVRLYDIEGKDSTATLKLFKPVKNAEQTNIIEEGGKPLPVKKGTVEIPVGHHAIETIKIRRE